MDHMAVTILLLAWTVSVGGAVMLCSAIATRARTEARRERFGLSPGRSPWP